MAQRKKYTPEQIVSLLRQVEVAVASGKTTAQASKEASITEQTYYRWRKEYGGLQVDQALWAKRPSARPSAVPGRPDSCRAGGARPPIAPQLAANRRRVPFQGGGNGGGLETQLQLRLDVNPIR
jgi:hypothetical protein